ncbi:averantin oxidoreductase [Xylariales sp. PMI_506]|nr:averantin oxidoreductase [Xylariales sp. PMI_506]
MSIAMIVPSAHALGSLQGLLLALLSSVLLAVVYYGCAFIYNIWFHPLSKYPGPWLAGASDWWLAWSYLGGRTPRDLLDLHNKYGEVVRISPGELSFINPVQWREIYGHRAHGQSEFSKDHKYHSGMKGEPVVINADRNYHGYIRKLLAHGFSDKSMREQERILQEYVNTLFRKLHEEGRDGQQPVDMVQWYTFLTFDFIGFLTFGESFDCLTSSSLHLWIECFFGAVRILAYHQGIARLPYILRIPAALWVIPSRVKIDFATLTALTTEKVKHRLSSKSEVPDFMDKLIDAYNDKNMSFAQLEGNARILTVAGSETTATLLAGLTFLLVKNPSKLEKLKTEIRAAFQTHEDMTITNVNNCKYLLACIEEALRLYPPSPQPHQRIIPAGGATINDEFLPEGTCVGIPIYAIANSPMNWAHAAEFIPERWTGEDPRFAGDKRDASQPFSYGPRNCIGRNLAYTEMKIIIARLVWEFDLELATQGDWIDQKVYMVWEKPPLWMKLHPVRR